jgi:hypothetical protein
LERIFTELSNPVWWFSVVLVGIAINVLSSYLRGALDGFFSKSSSWWRNRSEARKKAWEERVDRIVSSIEERNLAIADELRMRLGAIVRLLLSIIIFCYALFFDSHSVRFDFLELLSLVLFAAYLIFSFFTWNEAEYLKLLLKEAQARSSRQLAKEHADA